MKGEFTENLLREIRSNGYQHSRNGADRADAAVLSAGSRVESGIAGLASLQPFCPILRVVSLHHSSKLNLGCSLHFKTHCFPERLFPLHQRDSEVDHRWVFAPARYSLQGLFDVLEHVQALELQGIEVPTRVTGLAASSCSL